MADDKVKTPLLDELEKGPWPSFVKEIKNARQTSPMCDDLLGQLEAFLRGEKGPLEARRHRGRHGLRRRSHRALQRRAREVPERGALPHHARQPAFGVVLHERRPADPLRHLGAPRIRPHQHARLHGRHRLPGHQDGRARALLQGAGRGGLRPGWLRLVHANSLRLRRHGALRVGLLRHDEDLQRHHAPVPGRAAPPALPLQVQVQVLRLPERLRGLHRPFRPLRHRHLEGRDPAGRRRR